MQRSRENGGPESAWKKLKSQLSFHSPTTPRRGNNYARPTPRRAPLAPRPRLYPRRVLIDRLTCVIFVARLRRPVCRRGGLAEEGKREGRRGRRRGEGSNEEEARGGGEREALTGGAWGREALEAALEEVLLLETALEEAT